MRTIGVIIIVLIAIFIVVGSNVLSTKTGSNIELPTRTITFTLNTAAGSINNGATFTFYNMTWPLTNDEICTVVQTVRNLSCTPDMVSQTSPGVFNVTIPCQSNDSWCARFYNSTSMEWIIIDTNKMTANDIALKDIAID